MVDGGFRINEASVLKWSDIDFDNGVIYLYRSKLSNDDISLPRSESDVGDVLMPVRPVISRIVWGLP